MYKLEYLPAAHRDLIEIASYIAVTLKNPVAAEKLASKLIAEIEKTVNFPYANPAYIPIRPLQHEYRKLLVESYMVFYWVDETEKCVTIARAIYARSDYDTKIEVINPHS